MTKAEALYCGDAGSAYWQRNAPRLDREHAARSIALRRLLRPLPPPATYDEPSRSEILPWLEVGCGRGHNLRPHDVGLDCDVRQLSHLPLGAIPIIGHAYDLSMFPTASFAVVFSVGCLMHLPRLDSLHPGVHFAPMGCWERATAEMARVSSRYVLLGEYWADTEEPVTGKHWEGCLWRRPYTIPGFTELKRVQPVAPFDPDVTFVVYERRESWQHVSCSGCNTRSYDLDPLSRQNPR